MADEFGNEDIVLTLRDLAKASQWPAEVCVFTEAADEIGRLRARADGLSEQVRNMREWDPVINAMQADRDRLRAALERIAESRADPHDPAPLTHWAADMQRIARAALAGDAKPTGCNRKLAPDQWWTFCGETDMGQGLPSLCVECGGTLRLAQPEPVFVHGMSTHADHGAVEIVGAESPASASPTIPESNDRADAPAPQPTRVWKGPIPWGDLAAKCETCGQRYGRHVIATMACPTDQPSDVRAATPEETAAINEAIRTPCTGCGSVFCVCDRLADTTHSAHCASLDPSTVVPKACTCGSSSASGGRSE